MVAHTAFLLLVCCGFMQHTGALQQSHGPSEGEDGGFGHGELLGAVTERKVGRQKRQVKICELTWNSATPPIILNEKTHEIVQPTLSNGNKIIRIRSGEDVIISCERKGFIKAKQLGRPSSRTDIVAVRAYCEKVNIKNVGDKNMLVVDLKRNEPLSRIKTVLGRQKDNFLQTDDLDHISCQRKIEDTVIATKEQCGTGGNIYHIVTFYFDNKNKENNEFFSQVKVCFNSALKTTLWTQHTLRHDIKDIGRESSTWRHDQLFKDIGTDQDAIKNAYNGLKTQALLTKILNWKVIYLSSQPRPDNVPSEAFFAKGHLSPDADFVTPAERRATYHYINALPQWQADNNGNWKNIVETSVRQLAKIRGKNLIIITGGHGILQMKDDQDKIKEIYLKESNEVPVPELLWKVVFDPATEEGVAFVTSNDPYIGTDRSPTTEYGTETDATKKTKPLTHLCEYKNDRKVCSELHADWFKINTKKRPIRGDKVTLDNYKRGYTYCCEVKDLMKKITTIPERYGNFDLSKAKLLTLSVRGRA